MARFIPDGSAADIPHDSERLVYESLRSLPDGYVVLHSFPWLRPDRDLVTEPIHEGEADFVIVHPDKGMLVLEVKGGLPELRGRTWFRGSKEMRDPFEQSRRNRYALLEAIEEGSRGKVKRSMLTHGDAVVFPHCRYVGQLPPHADPRIVLDADATNEITTRIEQAFVAWQRRPGRLTPIQFGQLLEALMPKLRLLRCASAELAAERQRIVQVTQDQRATLRGLLANSRVLVEGSAGSGKTLLAVDFAVSLAVSGARVLFLCFNRHLATWLQEQASADARLRGIPGALEILTFHSYALALARRAGVEFEVPDEGAQEFWDEEVPLILEQAIDLLRAGAGAPLYDSVVIDEAQDFSPDWWVTVEGLTRGARQGRLYAFLDLHQSLRGDPRPPSIPFETRFRLTTNCRNTKSIARSAGLLAALETRAILAPRNGFQARFSAPGTRRLVRAAALAAARSLASLRR